MTKQLIFNTDIGDVDQPTVDWSVIGGNAMKSLGSIAVTWGLWACLLAAIVAAILIAFGHFGGHKKAYVTGIVGIICAFLGALVLGSAALIVNTGAHTQL